MLPVVSIPAFTIDRHVTPMLDIQVDRADIAQRVKSGEYYREARAWYADVHQAPLNQRIHMILAAMVALLALGLAVTALLSFLPLTRQVPVPVHVGDLTLQAAAVQGLSRRGEDPDAALMRYMAQYYVEQREAYRVDELATSVSAVQALSNENVTQAYRTWMSPQNPQSPLVLYQRTSARSVRILSTRLFTREEPKRAQVEYEATVLGAAAKAAARYTADIAFSYSPVTVNEDTGDIAPFQFQVTAYDTKEKASTAP